MTHRMFVITYSGTHPEIVADVLRREGVAGYTCVNDACGQGSSGPRQGTRAFPGKSALFFSVVALDRADALRAALKSQAGHMPEGERLHTSILGVEEFF